MGSRDSRLWLAEGVGHMRLVRKPSPDQYPLLLLGAAASAHPSGLTLSICDRTLSPLSASSHLPLYHPHLYLNILPIRWYGETQNSKMCIRPTHAHEPIAQKKIISLFQKPWKLCCARSNFIKLITADTYLMQRVIVRSLVQLCATTRLFYDNIRNNVLKDKFNQWNSVYIQRWKRVKFCNSIVNVFCK